METTTGGEEEARNSGRTRVRHAAEAAFFAWLDTSEGPRPGDGSTVNYGFNEGFRRGAEWARAGTATEMKPPTENATVPSGKVEPATLIEELELALWSPVTDFRNPLIDRVAEAIQEAKVEALREAAELSRSMEDNEPDGYYGQACHEVAAAILASANGTVRENRWFD